MSATDENWQPHMQQIHAGTVGASCCAPEHLNEVLLIPKSSDHDDDDGKTEEQTKAALNCARQKKL